MKTKVLMLIPTLNLVGGAQDQLKILSNELNILGVNHDIKTIYSHKKNSSYRFFTEIILFLKLIIFSIKYKVIHLLSINKPFCIRRSQTTKSSGLFYIKGINSFIPYSRLVKGFLSAIF